MALGTNELSYVTIHTNRFRGYIRKLKSSIEPQ